MSLHTHNTRYTKTMLSEHLGTPHDYQDGAGRWFTRYTANSPAELRRWTRDELEAEHRELHPEGVA